MIRRHPDRRGHQSRQLRRAAAQLSGEVIGINTMIASNAPTKAPVSALPFL